MSASHSTFGAAGRNWRSTRSSATRTPGTWIVVRPRLRGTRPEMPGALHQPLDTLAPDSDTEAEAQLSMDPRRAIDTALGVVDLFDLLEQPRVGQRPVRRRPALSVMEAGAVDLERAAEHSDGIGGLLRGDEREHLAYRPSVSQAKK